MCWEIIPLAFKPPQARLCSLIAFWYPFTSMALPISIHPVFPGLCGLSVPSYCFSLAGVCVCEDELWALKASKPLACWNSSLNVGLLQTAVIATSIKNISCPQDMAVFWKHFCPMLLVLGVRNKLPPFLPRAWRRGFFSGLLGYILYIDSVSLALAFLWWDPPSPNSIGDELAGLLTRNHLSLRMLLASLFFHLWKQTKKNHFLLGDWEKIFFQVQSR